MDFLDNIPADLLASFGQSKNLSNITAKRAVCVALVPTVNSRAFPTELLRTCTKQCP